VETAWRFLPAASMRVEGAGVLPRTLWSREHSSPMIVVQLARVTSGHNGYSRSPSCPVGGITGRDLSDSKLIVQAGEIDGRHAGGRCKSPAGLRSGDGPLSVRARPSRLKRDCASRATSTGGKCLVNVHAKSRLIPEPLRALRSEDKGRRCSWWSRSCCVPSDGPPARRKRRRR
jgi:hypothetical protein